VVLWRQTLATPQLSRRRRMARRGLAWLGRPRADPTDTDSAQHPQQTIDCPRGARARCSSCLPTVTFPPTPSVSSPLHRRDSSQTDARDCFGSDGQTRSRPVSVCLSACPCLSFCCRWAWSVDKRARCLIGGNSSRDRTKLQRHKKTKPTRTPALVQKGGNVRWPRPPVVWIKLGQD